MPLPDRWLEEQAIAVLAGCLGADRALEIMRGLQLPLESVEEAPVLYPTTIAGVPEDVGEMEFQRMLAEGALEAAQDETGVVASPHFFVWKSDHVRCRLVWDGRAINALLPEEEVLFLEDARTAAALVRPGQEMAVLDMKDAYLQVKLAKAMRRFFALRHNGRLYVFRGMPFGLAPAARVITEVFRPFLERTRARGVPSMVFIDDWFAVGPRQNSLLLKEDLTRCGLALSDGKEQHGTSVRYLGLDWDSVAGVVRVPAEKIAKLRRHAAAALTYLLRGNDGAAEALTRKVTGCLAAMFLLSPKMGGEWRSLRPGTPREAWERALLRVLALTQAPLTAPLFPRALCLVISDASNWGYGFVVVNLSRRLRLQRSRAWTTEEAARHINIREMLAAVKAAEACPEQAGIVQLVDNTVAEAWLRRTLPRTICDVVRVPTELNVADALSRGGTEDVNQRELTADEFQLHLRQFVFAAWTPPELIQSAGGQKVASLSKVREALRYRWLVQAGIIDWQFQVDPRTHPHRRSTIQVVAQP